MDLLPILWTVAGIAFVIWITTIFLFGIAGAVAKYVNKCRK
jgi:hypothetical protein